MTVTITIPTMLAKLVNEGRKHQVEADTVDDAIEALLQEFPELRVHLFGEGRSLRPHVRCFHNDVLVADRSSPTRDGDTITLLQAVSGGLH